MKLAKSAKLMQISQYITYCHDNKPIFESERSRYSHVVPWHPARAFSSCHTYMPS